MIGKLRKLKLTSIFKQLSLKNMQERNLLNNNLQPLQNDKKKVILIYFNSNNLNQKLEKDEPKNEFVNTLYEDFQQDGIKPYYISFFSPEKNKGEKRRSLQERDEKLWKQYVATKPRIINLSVNPEFLEYYHKGFFCNGGYKINRDEKNEIEFDDLKYNYDIKDEKSVNFYKEWLEKIIQKNPKSQIIIVDKGKFLSPFIGKVAKSNMENENLYFFSSDPKGVARRYSKEYLGGKTKKHEEQKMLSNNELEDLKELTDIIIKYQKKLSNQQCNIAEIDSIITKNFGKNELFNFESALKSFSYELFKEYQGEIKHYIQKREQRSTQVEKNFIKEVLEKVENKNLNLLNLSEDNSPKSNKISSHGLGMVESTISCKSKIKSKPFEQRPKVECSIL